MTMPMGPFGRHIRRIREESAQTDGETTQFRRPDETLINIAGSFRKDHACIVHERTSEAQGRSQNTKRDEGATPTIPRIVVAEQWLCLLLGLVCMICGVYGLFMKYNQGSSNAYIRWLGPAYGPILRFTAISCIALGAVLVRQGLARPDQSSFSVGSQFCDLHTVTICTDKGENGKATNMKDDPDDIPMVYLLYVALAIVVLLTGAAIVVAKIL
jgi:hypothetical protein